VAKADKSEEAQAEDRMTELYFKTLDDANVAVVRNVPLGRGRQQAIHIMRSQQPSFVLISEAEYTQLKAELDKRKQVDE
jgi:hypothetical protein